MRTGRVPLRITFAGSCWELLREDVAIKADSISVNSGSLKDMAFMKSLSVDGLNYLVGLNKAVHLASSGNRKMRKETPS